MSSSVSVRRHGGRRRSAQAGATSLEFALTGSILLSLLLGSVETGRYMFTLEMLRFAAADAARLVALRGSQNRNAGSSACAGLSGPLSGVTYRTPFLRADMLVVSLSNCVTAGGVTTVSVALQYPFTFSVPYFGVPSRQITETAQAVFR